MDVCLFECCVLSGRGLCDGLITRPEESYRLWCVVVCDQETSKTRRLKSATGLCKIQPQWVVTPGKRTNNKQYLLKTTNYAQSYINICFKQLQNSFLVHSSTNHKLYPQIPLQKFRFLQCCSIIVPFPFFHYFSLHWINVTLCGYCNCILTNKLLKSNRSAFHLSSHWLHHSALPEISFNQSATKFQKELPKRFTQKKSFV